MRHPRLQLEQISIQGLFGRFDHKIPIGDVDPIQIIYGRNGVGKTTLLRLVHALFQRKLSTLRSTPFDLLKVSFSSGAILTVKPVGMDDPTLPDMQISLQRKRSSSTGSGEERPRQARSSVGLAFRLDDQTSSEDYGFVDWPLAPSDLSLSLAHIERSVPQLERIDRDVWVDMSTGQHMGLEDVLNLYEEDLPGVNINRWEGPERAWLQQLLDVVRVELIETQRLHSPMPTVRPGHRSSLYRSLNVQASAAQRYAEEFVKYVKQTRDVYTGMSQSLDSKFMSRVLAARGQPTPGEEEIRRRYDDLRRKSDLLARYAVQEAEELIPIPGDRSLDTPDLEVFNIYLEDTEEKFAVFDEYLESTQLFQTIIDGLFHDKTILFDQHEGFYFRTEDGTIISPSMLSSGEQHEFVLTYDLLFRFERGSVILIDEPEISLHVAWQRRLVSNLQEIAAHRGLEFVIATHSPQIAASHKDRMIELSG